MDAVKQITQRRHPVAEVSARLGVSQHSLYEWIRKYSQPEPVRSEAQTQHMCRMMAVHPSGYYAWRAAPVSTRQRERIRRQGP